jgi:hypothetical protein
VPAGADRIAAVDNRYESLARCESKASTRDAKARTGAFVDTAKWFTRRPRRCRAAGRAGRSIFVAVVSSCETFFPSGFAEPSRSFGVAQGRSRSPPIIPPLRAVEPAGGEAAALETVFPSRTGRGHSGRAFRAVRLSRP